MKFVLTLTCLLGLLNLARVNAEPLIEGRVRLDSGEPVADAQVRLFDMTDLRQGAIARALTDGTGYFALPLAALRGRALPEDFALGPNYPNPFNPSTIIPYQLAASSQVRLEVFNLLGQRIATLVDGERPAGFHTARWHATDAAGRAVGAGVYIYRMTVGAASQTGRMVLIDGQAGVAAGGASSIMPGASESSGLEGEDAQVYGLIVSGEGLVPYVDSSFRVEAGMVPVELVVSAGSHSAGKVTDDACALCGFLGESKEEEEEALIVYASVNDNILTPGQAFTLRARVQNQGTDEFQNLVLSYYRSSDATISTQDMLLGTDEVGSLAASSTSGNESISLTAPSTSGTYYYGACVASVSDESDTPNYCSTGVRVSVADEDEQVVIPDANLRAAIEEALGKASGASITVAEMATLIILVAEEAGIGDLTGLEFAANLEVLGLSYNHLTDISVLSGLTNLTSLDFHYNNVSDISALRGLTNLTSLDFNGNNASDISALRGLTNLTWLQIWHNNISDISALAGLTNLKTLYLHYNNITDVSALRGLTNLETLGLGDNDITDISPLRGLTNLTWLYLKGNFLSASSINDHIPVLQDRGVTVAFDPWFDTTPVITTENLVAQHDGVAQHDDQVVVMSVPGRLKTDPIDFDALAQFFFAHYEDAFDYLMVFSNLADIRDNQHYEYYGIHHHVQNTVQGTGSGRYSRNQEVGSAGRLNAILHFPYNSALLYGPSLHEIMHSWANYAIPTAVWAPLGVQQCQWSVGRVRPRQSD